MSSINSLMSSYQREMKNIGEIIGTTSPNKIIKESKIYAIDGVTRHNISPMLIDRFIFCDRWDEFYLSQNMLSLDEINSFPYDAKLTEWINLRKENWDHVPPKSIGDSLCSIFSFNPYELEEIYLDWSECREEPTIWHCLQSDYYKYNNLEEFFIEISKI
ncbi:hypothetical protein [Delftia sp. PS-11]|uniref:hypothetical protein n=1 Tax=Delftia sp. PS-11 TaxID=2767222 RepID=UPI002453CF38|nr:hypothetical protein [Delftia sp. PS-11]KAJ8743943.1 hypothetical protein H9T68_15055 [Delftia sp. PS-11]